MKIVLLGGGSFGTALANQLADNTANEICILLRNPALEKSINQTHINTKYFPKRPLRSSVKASCDVGVLANAEVILLCTPTKSITAVASLLKENRGPNALIVNTAKGVLENGETIVEYLRKELRYKDVISMKGASFSAEMINSMPTLFTVGFDRRFQLEKLMQMTKHTNIFLDYTNDIRGVELLSALKNIYAIALGNVDAKYNALNTRFMILTKAIEEIKVILRNMGGAEETIFLCCGIGDIALTGLSDLSRNRTLGLLIGKGFYNEAMAENAVVLEGCNTLRVIDQTLSDSLKEKLPLLHKVKLMLQQPLDDHYDFQELFRRKYKTVLTYGTYDLLHFGHLELLRRLRELGDRVIVGLSTDEFNQQKRKDCVMNYEKRKHLLEVLSYVDLVIPEKTWDQKIEDIKNYGVDLFVMGSDWEGKFDFLKPYCEVRYLPRTEGISTTKLKSIIKE